MGLGKNERRNVPGALPLAAAARPFRADGMDAAFNPRRSVRQSQFRNEAALRFILQQSLRFVAPLATRRDILTDDRA